ncbi:MAG: DUF3164 family protein [Zoogloeaceae bacterium]|jgi:hypothetical protein|nr:DUF3164 family protein [Zoogloeaceae bacterium]
MNQTALTVPPGYRQDAAGRLIPVETIKPIDLARDELVQEIVAAARVLNGQMAAFKARTFADIAAFVQLSAEQYQAKLGGKKGNVTLFSFDGKYKIQRAIAEYIVFDERLQAAKALIDECITDWTQGSRPELHVLVNDAFQVDKEGNINTGRVLGLRRLEISDSRWREAMRAIGEAVQVVGSKSYVRVYERVGDSDEYKPIALDVAGVAV